MFSKFTSKIETLVDLLRYRSLHQTNERVFTFLENGETETDWLTYLELDTQAQAIAASLQSLGMTGERALLLYPPGLEFISAFFGCLYAGVVAVPAYPPRHNQKMSRLEAIALDAQARVALTTTSILGNIKSQADEAPALAGLHWLTTDKNDHSQISDWQELRSDRETLAFLQYTSGSTGIPKGVMVSHGNILHNEQTIDLGLRNPDEAVYVNWMPLYHDMGLIGNVLQALYLGVPCIVMPPGAFIQKPFRWLQAITRYRATTSGGPNFAYDECVRRIKPEQLTSLDLSAWEVAFNGAEPVRAETLKRFAKTFAACGFRQEAFYPCYGMAEVTLFVSGGIKTDPPVIYAVNEESLQQNLVMPARGDGERSRMIVGCGQSWLGQKIVIVNPESLTKCADEEVGEIWVSGRSVTQGYWNRSQETQKTFKAHIIDTGEGPFLRTGDLGFLRNGELFVTGRIKDVIIIKGQNHYPQDIELTVQESHPALRLNCGSAFTVKIEGQERLIVVQEVERNYLRKLNVDEVLGNIRQAVAAEHNLQVYATALIKTNSIPKTSSGKIQRHACHSAFINGSLDVVYDWSENPQLKTEFRHLQAEMKSLLEKLQATNCLQ
ncbi:AMP-dependent synthetase [Nostoc sp. ATCC 43529]|nr:AMP-dependent synthetase [Nostoc sp. ATCC 43529]